MCPQTHGQTQRVSPWVAESHPQGSFNYGLLWWIILICLVHSPYFVDPRILPCVCMHVLAKMDPSTKACGYLSITPLWLSRSISVHVWLGSSPDSENEKYVVWQGPVSSLNCPAILILEFQSMGNESSIALPSEVGKEAIKSCFNLTRLSKSNRISYNKAR